MTTESLNFSADVARLLEIVAHALYSNRDVFLRELISNAADACDRLRYEAIEQPDLTKGGTEFKIRVAKDTETRTVTVKDNGIGMDRAELIDNLGTIAKSGTKALMEQVAAAKDNDGKLSLIGQFGVGFYASFMASDKVEVISRKAGEDKAFHWESDGRTGFDIREAKKKETDLLEDGRGTTIILHIRDDASDYLIDEKLKMIIQTYSDHIDFPVYLGEEEGPVNRAAALWARPKNEVTDEEYLSFYHNTGCGVDDPLLTCHWKAEGTIEYTAMLFVPSLRPYDLYDPTRRHAIRLYVKRVFISDDCEGLIFPWLRFLRGVVDSADLPLNISREMLQHNPVMARIRNGIARKVLGDLNKLSEDDPDTFTAFWGQFGPVIKEGLYDAVEHRDELLKVARFYSTHEEGKLASLADYAERMQDGQECVYYLSGENLETLKNSPQLEGFRARGIEVLFFTDTIDDFWLQSVLDYDGKPFKSVTKGDIDLSQFDTEKNDEKEEDQSDFQNESLEKLIEMLKETLEEEVSDIRATTRLTDSPVCLVAAENEVDMRMERVLRLHQQYTPNSKRVMEINGSHPLILNLAAIAESSEFENKIRDASFLLLDQARIIQGEPVPDPAAFARRMTQVMEAGLAA